MTSPPPDRCNVPALDGSSVWLVRFSGVTKRMYRSRRILIGVCSIVASSLILVPAAHATADDGTDVSATARDVSGAGDQVPEVEQKRATSKMDLAAAYVAMRDGEVSAADYAKTVASSDPIFEAETPSGVGQQATTNVLRLRTYRQINNFFCGPATGKMILKYLKEGRSAVNGAYQDQDHIGGASHMRTWQNRVTSWTSGNFRKGLNLWRSAVPDGYYVDLDSPTVSQFVNALRYDIDLGFPFGADTVEFAGGIHYNNHPTDRLIGHWIEVHGYYDSAARTRFADGSRSVWPDVNPHFTYDTSLFVQRFLGSNGITW